MTQAHAVLHGIGVSAGMAIGNVVQVPPAAPFSPDEPATTDSASAIEKVHKALEQVASGLEARMATVPEHARAVLEATAMMARDPGLTGAIDTRLTSGTGVTRAVHDAVEEFATMFANLGGYMAERVTDLHDVRDRTISRLLGREEPGVPKLTSPAVIVAHDLAPAETAAMDKKLVLGIITAAGGPTSHTAILAAQLGIPAVVKTSGALELPNGTVVAVNGSTGEVIISPSQVEQDELLERAERRAAALKDSHGSGATKDGHAVALLANIGTLDDAKAAAAQDVEGSGLFRTEFLFLGQSSAPTVAEQTAIYTEVLRSFGDRRVVIRTLDAGADKPLSFANLGEEENPALGRRGIRLGFAIPQLLEDQLAALGAAHRETDADLRVMAPMIATCEEAEQFAESARAAGLPSVGIMIEVPAAALRSQDLLAIVDFASIGTNDLSQYTMAADRMEGELANLLDPWQPAVLQLIQHSCAGGQTNDKKVGVCGEAGGDPLLALVLVGLGVSSLSMAPGKVPAVRASLGMHTLELCQQMASAAVGARTATDARQAVLDLADQELNVLL
ncbi:MAG: phosphoenolpyruvate--protein phosphotransferase [Propionibacteriaceae bacterium]|nr:phosphoenolpyruvate--protein phosphotransferase [Propionibacteriaceae bacterium]